MPFYFLSLFIGALLPFAFAPFAFWPLAIFSPLGFLFVVDYALNHQKKKQLLTHAYLFGLGFYGLGVSWVYVSIHVYGHTPAPIAALLAFLFSGGLALVSVLHILVYQYFNFHRFYILSFPASWVMFEWFRSWFLSGFPWLYNGYAFIDSPLASLANIVGVYGLSFLSIFIASLLFFMVKTIVETFNTRKIDKKQQKNILAGFVMIVGIIVLAQINSRQSWTSINPEASLQFELIQGNVSQHDKWLPQNQRLILNNYGSLISQVFEKYEHQEIKPQVVIVLPEAAMPALQSEIQGFFNHLDNKSKNKNMSLISGIFYDEDAKAFYSDNVYNSIIAVGMGTGLYHKQRLVPFGEYVPLEDFIRGALPFFDLPFSSFTRGAKNQQGLENFGITIAPFICYEILYPNLVYQQGKDADILLTISNDAWFGNSSGPAQHFQMARMRALELGKYLVRTTNTGTTAVVDHHGKVIRQLPSFETAILSETVYVTQGKTPFSYWGPLPILVFSALLCFLVILLFLQERFSRK